MGERKYVGSYALDIGDYGLVHGRLVRVTAKKTEYDYDLPHHHWYATEDVATGLPLPKQTRGDHLEGPLNAMEVIAWSSR